MVSTQIDYSFSGLFSLFSLLQLHNPIIDRAIIINISKRLGPKMILYKEIPNSFIIDNLIIAIIKSPTKDIIKYRMVNMSASLYLKTCAKTITKRITLAIIANTKQKLSYSRAIPIK